MLTNIFRTLNFTSSGYIIMRGILYFRLNNKRKFPVTSQNDHVSLFIDLKIFSA